MGKFCDSMLSLCLGFLVLNALVESSPVGNETVSDDYIEMATKTIPKACLFINLRLTKNLTKENPGENVLFSGLGAYSALMMLHLGAGDKTREELDKVFKIRDKDIDHTKLHETFSALLKLIEHKPSGPDDTMPETLIANGFFVQKDRPILDSFIHPLEQYYGAKAKNVDFLEHASEATNEINTWVSENTKKRIEKMYTSPLSSTTISVLTNALYFHGLWKYPFNKENTKMGKFNTGTTEIEVPMMQDQKMVHYSYSDNLLIESIELPYKGGEHTMVIFLPYPSQTMQNFTKYNHLFDIHEFHRNRKQIAVDYKIPKTRISWTNSLVNALGLQEIFENADLSRMSAEKVPVSDVFQATDMEIDEQGTIATAATVISNTRLLTPPVQTEKKFYIDRPYMMTIVHKRTQTILFQSVTFKP